MAFFLMTQAACSMFGIRGEETPPYEVIVKDGNKEIRQYSSYVIAKTVVEGDYRKAQREGFRILAGYIFGDNEKKMNISMTAPVAQSSQSASEKISMTAPVTQSAPDSNNSNSWIMTFMMPSKYQLSELPTPKDQRVLLEEVPPKLVASIQYTGSRAQKNNAEKANQLKNWISLKGEYSIIGVPTTAGYDPPWTLPFFRRNEVHFEVIAKKKN